MIASNSTLLMRADAGPTVGTGHVMRSLALGKSWVGMGGKALLVSGDLPRALRVSIEEAGIQVEQLRGGRDAADAIETREIAIAESADWIVLIGDRFGVDYQKSVKSPDAWLGVIDEFGFPGTGGVDLVLNPNVGASSELYPGVDATTGLLLGPRYLLMDQEFSGKVQRRVRKPTPAIAKKILIAINSDDQDNVILEVLQSLNLVNCRDLVVDVLVGARYRNGDELDAFKRQSGLNLRFHRNIDRLHHLMGRADMAICASGMSCYQLIRSGVPSLVIATDDHQSSIACRLEELGVASYVGMDGGCLVEELSGKFGLMQRDPGQRREMSLRGRKLVDGQGADRLARYLSSIRYVLNEVTEREAKPRRKWWMVRDQDGSPAGQVRCCIESEKTASIEVSVCEHWRGHGLGTVLIEKACRQLFSGTEIEEVVAAVPLENRSAQNLFLKAGFQPQASSRADSQSIIRFVYRRSLAENVTAGQQRSKQRRVA